MIYCKTFLRKIFCAVVFLLISSTVFFVGGKVFATGENIIGFNSMNVPLLSGYVSDFTNTFSDTQIMELRSIAEGYQQQTSNELVAVLIPHRQDRELFDIGLKIFRENGIGSKKNNNGILLLIATEEKKIRIIVGYGLEGVFPDVAASEVIENYVRPLVNVGDFYGAIKAFYDTVPKYIEGEYVAEPVTTPDMLGVGGFFLRFIGGIVVGYLGTLGAKNGRTLKKKKKKSTMMQSVGKPILIWLLVLGLIAGFILSAGIFVFGLFLGSIIAGGGFGGGRGNSGGFWGNGFGGGSFGGGWSGGSSGGGSSFGGFGGGSSGGGGAGD